MASNNNTNKKQKRTAVDGDSSPLSTTVIIVSALSFGSIVHNFPEFFMYLLPYIADRRVFNSIASCNRDTHAKSKAIVPPWPKIYRFPASHYSSIAVWSPDGTRVAYTSNRPDTIIAIVDQRHGIIHRIENNRGFCFSDLKFSPNGRFLFSACDRDGIVNLWDNVTGNYEQLQEWNIREEEDDFSGYSLASFDISACSKYIVMATYSSHHVVLKSVENGKTVRFLTRQPDMKYINEVRFSVDCHAVLIGCDEDNGGSVIKVWHPYLDDDDEDILITLWEQNYEANMIVSHDKTMIAIQDTVGYRYLNKGWFLSIGNNYSCTVQELNFQGSAASIRLLDFTTDDKCIIYETENGLKYWNVATRKCTGKEYLLCDKRTMKGFKVVNFSPNNHQLIVQYGTDGKEDDYEKEDEDEFEEESPLYMKSIA